MVIDVSRKFIPDMASGFNNEKLTLHVADGFSFLEEHSLQYDVIIADISDPDGTFWLFCHIVSYSLKMCYNFCSRAHYLIIC